MNGSINGNDNTGHDDEIPTAPLQLSVIIYTGGGIHRHNRPGPAQHVIVRMYPHTPFKHLADKLRERWGDRELRLSELPCEYVFDGDTPAYVSGYLQKMLLSI